MENKVSATQQKITLQPQQTTEILASSGQNIAVGATAQGAVLKDNALVITFDNGAKLVIKNYGEVAAAGAQPTLTQANGQTLTLASLIDGSAQPATQQQAQAPGEFMPTLGDGKAATAPVKTVSTEGAETINMPKPGQEVVVTLVDGTNYVFGFSMTDPATVTAQGNQLVITFKNGGELIIPNYGSFAGDSTAPQITLKDGTMLSATNMGDVLASAAALNDVEPAAGGAGGAGGRGGFGFQSAFAASPFVGIDPIGPINPTQLQYDTSDRRPEPILTTPAAIIPPPPVPPVPNLTVNNSQTPEDTPVGLQVSSTPNNPNEQITITIVGIPSTWTVDTSTSGGTYDPATGTWTYTAPPGTPITQGPILTPPADSDVDLPDLQVSVSVTDTVTGLTSTTTGEIDVIVDAVVDGPSVTANGSGDEDTAIPLNININVGGDNTDGSESITSIVIGGLPPGATLSAGTYDAGTNTWTLTPPQLVGLTMTPPLHYSGTINATVTVTEYDNPTDSEYNPNDNTAVVTTPLDIVVNPVPDAPELTVKDAQVLEDGSVQLEITANLVDQDGSEQLTVTISGFPAGWTVDPAYPGATYANGVWTYTLPVGTTSFTGGPIVSPPADSDIDLNNLQVTATATEVANNTSANTSAQLDVIVDAVVDGPAVDAQNASGAEDTAIPLNISINVGGDNTDGSESITSIVISGLPAGSTLSAGTYNAGTDSWTLTQAQLNGLKLTPPQNYNGVINATVTVTEYDAPTDTDFIDTNNTAVVTDSFTITVTPENDTPGLNVDDAQVKEDGQTQLPISATLAPNSGAGDYMVITVTGIAPGWTLAPGSQGTLSNGTWTLTVPAGQPYTGGPTLKPPADSDVDLTGLNVTVKQYDSNNVELGSNSDTAKIIVDAVIDAPTLTASGSGAEDTPIDLNININPQGDATDGSERITSIKITGMPAGATLSAGTYDAGTNTWTLTPAQLANLKLNPPANYSGNIPLTVTVTEYDQPTDSEYDLTDNTATVSTPLNVTVTPVPDAPQLIVRDEQVKEDNSVALNIQANLVDTDGSEQLTVTITGLAGWTVTDAKGGTWNQAAGTWTITMPAGQNFSGGPVIKPPADSDADLNNIQVTATSTELANNTSASTSDTIDVIVDAVIDAPTLTVANASGEEDTAIALNINVGKGGDAADNSEVLSNITISGVPSGAVLSAGTNLGGGVWSVTPAQLAGLKITPPLGFDGSFNLTVSVTDTETNLSGQEYDYSDNSATVTRTLTVNVGPDDEPQIIDPAARTVDETSFDTGAVGVTGTITANFFSDNPGSFAPTAVADFSFGGSAKNGQLTSNGVPVTVTIVGDTYVGKAGGNTVFTLKVAADGSYDFKLLDTLDHADVNNPDDTITLNFGVKATDSDGDTDTTTLTINVKDDGVVANDDHNTVAVNGAGEGSAAGNVITGQNGGPGAADDISQDAPNAVTAVKFGNNTMVVPAGGFATIQGTYGTLKIFSDGSYTYTLKPAATTHTVTVPVTTTTTSGDSSSSSSSSGDGSSSTSTSTSTSTTTTTTTTTTITVVKQNIHDEFTYTLIDADGDSDTATLTFDATGANKPLLTVQDEMIKEDGFGQLDITATLTNPAESLTVKVSGIPAGWIDVAASGGTYDAATQTWSITMSAGQNFSGGPVIRPPADTDADLPNLSVTATSTNANGAVSQPATDSIDVIVDAVIDAPTLTVANATGNEDTAIDLNISAGKGGDASDNSEVLSNVTISGVPAGATLSAGTNLGGGVWSLTGAQLAGLKINPPANYSGSFNLTVAVTDTETNLSGTEYDYTDNTATVTKTLAVTVGPVADTPTVGAVDKVVKEDGSVALQVNAALADTDGSEQLTVTISGIQPGWTVDTSVSGGSYNAVTGIWTLTLPVGVASFAGGPIVKPPANSDADLSNLIVRATATETANGSTASAEAGFKVVTDAVIDAPDLNVANASGEQDTAIALNITAGKGGDAADGSEVLSNITISGVPSGAILSAGTNLGGGVWSLTVAQLTGLKITPPANYTGSFNLTVSVTDTETNLSGLEVDYTDNTATVTKTLAVNVGPDDVPSIITPDAKQVDETNLSGGAQTVNGQVQANFYSDGPGTFAATGTGDFSFAGAKNGLLTSNGVAVTITQNGNQYIGKAGANEVFRLTINTDGTYSFVLSRTLDHANAADANDAIALNFGVKATDTDGDSASTSIQIRVLDDGPRAFNDVQDLTMSDTGAGSATGNVVTGQNGGAGAADTLSQDPGNVISQVSFGGTTVNVPASGTATIQGIYGTLTIAANGQYTYTLKPAVAGAATGQTVDAFNYTLKDGDGDSSSATLTLRALGSTIKVGSNDDDTGPNSDPYEVGTGTGTITGRGGSDILIGDAGGTKAAAGKDYNIVLILDVSGSMGMKTDPNSKYALLVKAVKNMMADLNDYHGGNVKVHIVPFATNVFQMGTFDVTTAAGYQQALSYLDNMNNSGGFTNYEVGMQAAIAWLQGQNQAYGKPIAGGETYSYFVTDGEPNRYVSSNYLIAEGTEARAMAEITGTAPGDSVSEVNLLKSLSTEVIGVGIDIGAKISNVNVIDSDGNSLNINDPQDLSAALSGVNPVNQLLGVGGDHIVGGDGNDLIFGDSVNTDVLAAAKGLTLPAGSGWAVFEQLEGNAAYNWTRTDTMNYIRSHTGELAVESTQGGNGRTGGNDTLLGGTGDDVIFGQEGNDLIIGGAGDDILSGGSGADTFRYDGNDGIDRIVDFNAAEGDILDISSIISGYDQVSDDIHNFVKIVHDGGNSLVQVDATGSGAAFHTIAVLQGVNVDVDNLVSGGNLIA